MHPTTTIETPRVWIGCLHCYNDGELIGNWFDAIDADEVSLADVHRGSGHGSASCEELWIMDHEYLPVRGEMSPHEAAEWAKSLTGVNEHLRPALRAWVESGNYTAEGKGDLPAVPDFEDAYAGEWDSFREYAEQLADDIDLLRNVPEEIKGYFHWDAWTRDLAFDYTTAPAPRGGVFMFRNS